jgi:hypothetical protein
MPEAKMKMVLSAMPRVLIAFQDDANVVVQFAHTRTVEALFRDHVLVFRLKVRPDVHARGIVPDEEGLARLNGAIHRVDCSSKELIVGSLRALSGEWSCINTGLLAQGPNRGSGERDFLWLWLCI